MDLAGQRVLIVEDEGIVAMVVEDYLEDLGCTVVAIAARLEEGEDAARHKAIDVAILDVNLASLSGILCEGSVSLDPSIRR